MIVPIVNLN